MKINRFRTNIESLPALNQSFSWARAEEINQDDQVLLETPGVMEVLAQHEVDIPGELLDMVRYVEGAEELADSVVLLLTGLYDGDSTRSVTVATAEVLDPKEYVLLLNT